MLIPLPVTLISAECPLPDPEDKLDLPRSDGELHNMDSASTVAKIKTALNRTLERTDNPPANSVSFWRLSTIWHLLYQLPIAAAIPENRTVKQYDADSSHRPDHAVRDNAKALPSMRAGNDVRLQICSIACMPRWWRACPIRHSLRRARSAPQCTLPGIHDNRKT